jgi:hypothetical protein
MIEWPLKNNVEGCGRGLFEIVVRNLSALAKEYLFRALEGTRQTMYV